jgi:hypothetical protein
MILASSTSGGNERRLDTAARSNTWLNGTERRTAHNRDPLCRKYGITANEHLAISKTTAVAHIARQDHKSTTPTDIAFTADVYDSSNCPRPEKERHHLIRTTRDVASLNGSWHQRQRAGRISTTAPTPSASSRSSTGNSVAKMKTYDSNPIASTNPATNYLNRHVIDVHAQRQQ